MDSMLGSWRFDVARSPGVLELYEDAGEWGERGRENGRERGRKGETERETERQRERMTETEKEWQRRKVKGAVQLHREKKRKRDRDKR